MDFENLTDRVWQTRYRDGCLIGSPTFESIVRNADAVGADFVEQFVRDLRQSNILETLEHEIPAVRAVRGDAITDGGRYLPVDYGEAMAILTILAKGGHAASIREVGSHAASEGDEAAAERHWKAAAAKGDAIAMMELGSLASRRGDNTGARTWLDRAADAAEFDEYAHESLAGLERLTWDVASTEFYDAIAGSAARGDAQLRAFVAGLGPEVAIPLDEDGRIADEHVPTVALLAQGGHIGALRELGWHALSERDDNDEARRLWAQAAESGDAASMLDLGFLAKQADDIESARAWYEKAAAAGSPDAADALGELDA